MKIARFIHSKKEMWGVTEGDSITVLRSSPFENIRTSGEQVSVSAVRLLPPSQPSKIILVGLNYYDHARELDMAVPSEPVLFMKPSTSIIGNEDDIVYPRDVRRLDYEAELAVVIKKTAKNVNEKQVPEFVLGYTCLNDVTARDLQKKDGQWTRAKSFDTFCPAGPWIETDIDPSDLRITSVLNKQIRQNSRTSQMIFSVPFIVSFISRAMTLLPGDIISTGTPLGVGEMKETDVIEIEIEGIGTLRNKVIKN
jgi:2-keto-4-pentenoate hydratase/2-oxohepta-3-ene-1,7-dioic acid hydratase in catechol pathway